MMKSVSPALHSINTPHSSYLTRSTSLPDIKILLDPSTPVSLKELERFEWTTTESSAEEFLTCMINLVTFNGCYIPSAFQLLAQGFIPKHTDAGCDFESYDKIAHLIHTTLQRILSLVPLSMPLLGTALKEQFPHKRNSPEVLFAYFKNFLLVSYYAPSLIESLISTAIDRLIQIDVDIKLDDIPEESDDLQFEVELEIPSDPVLTARKLDSMMIVMFEYLDAAFGNCEKEERENTFPRMNLNQNHRDNLFQLLLQTFDKYILTTYKSKYTQFLLFYVCRLKPHENNSFSARFMAYLFNKVQHKQNSSAQQIASSAYLGSFLSRAAFLPAPTIREVVTFMLNWTLAYVNAYTNASPDAVVHGLFYSMSQSLYYIFCFHNEALGADKNYVESLKKGYRRITESKLNPLKLCLPTIVREYVRIGAEMGWFDFNELLHANDKVVLATKSSFGGPNQLEMFFPFDPYLLKHSAKYITELYKNWAGADEEAEETEPAAFADSDDDSDDSSDDEAKNDDDDGEDRHSSDDMEQLTQDFMHFTPDVEKDIKYHFSFD